MDHDENEEEYKKQLFARVLGESTDSSHDGAQPTVKEDEVYIWESVEGIDGLWLCRDFLSEDHQNLILSTIDRQGWVSEGSSLNKAARFGDSSSWATELSLMIQKAICYGETIPTDDLELDYDEQDMEEPWPLPFDLLFRKPLFDQLVAVSYLPGEGLSAQVESMQFEDGIAIVSFESECVMYFCRADQETHSQGEEDSSPIKIPVLLNPGSLLMLHGEARYSWKHEINPKEGFQTWNGREIIQKKRTSVTMKKLRPNKD